MSRITRKVHFIDLEANETDEMDNNNNYNYKYMNHLELVSLRRTKTE